MAAVACASLPATGLNIVFTDVGVTPMSSAQRNAFQAGAQIWQSAFLDPVTVRINIAFEAPGVSPYPLPDTALGGTITARTTTSLASFLTAARSDATAAEERAALGMLPNTSLPITDINGPRNDTQVTVATANAKALGLGTGVDRTYGDPLPNSADALIKFNNLYAGSFDYDRTNGIGATLRDFVGVAAHEIGHALGFSSAADVQDRNPDYTLHPSSLDLWRFSETGGSHNVLTERRWVTAGRAEYYDTVLNNVSFSRGESVTTDTACFSASGSCQASHWRDNSPYLMKASLARGTVANPWEQDLHALDYIGWNRPGSILPRLGIRSPIRFRVGWYTPGGILPDFSGAFDNFSPPPDENTLPIANLDFEPNAAVRLGIDFQHSGFSGRSGLGLARFEDALPEPNAAVLQPESQNAPEDLVELGNKPMTLIPPRITDFMFLSDDDATQFLFTDALPEGGAMFDPSLGNFGGYRISGFVDAYGDNVNDVDGTMTFLLLSDNPSGVPSLANNSLFELVESEDNGLVIEDLSAFGISTARGDYNLNGVNDTADFVVWRKMMGQTGIGLAADGAGPNGGPDGVVDELDYHYWRANFGATAGSGTGSVGATDGPAAVPEPTTLAFILLAMICRPARRDQRHLTKN
jgi:hypothetical protein